MDEIKATSFEELPTVKKVLERIQHGESDLDITYQSAEINRCELAIEYIKSNHVQWVEAIEVCLAALKVPSL